MIIKKKYTTIKRAIEEIQEQQIQQSDAVQQAAAENIEQPNSIEDSSQEQAESNDAVSTEENKPQKQDKKKKKSVEDLDLALDNIKFEQREERREGTRRRGYRRTQDRNIITRAQKEAEIIKEAAKQEGYNEGVENANQDIAELKSKFTEFFNIKDEVFNKVSDCIFDISVEIAKKIINKSIETDREYIIPMIKGVVEEVNRTENKIILKVMPKDVEIVKDNISSIFSDNFVEATITVIPDNEIKDGGVIVETSNGLVDASIETQLAIIEKAFKKQDES